MKYHLVSENDVDMLNKKVNLLLAQGWNLHGNTIVMSMVQETGHIKTAIVYFYQAVIFDTVPLDAKSDLKMITPPKPDLSV